MRIYRIRWWTQHSEHTSIIDERNVFLATRKQYIFIDQIKLNHGNRHSIHKVWILLTHVNVCDHAFSERFTFYFQPIYLYVIIKSNAFNKSHNGENNDTNRTE